jgi:hypothetical protein
MEIQRPDMKGLIYFTTRSAGQRAGSANFVLTRENASRGPGVKIVATESLAALQRF